MSQLLPVCNQAHLGAGVLEIENTREAVELGWSLGLIPEIDVNTAGDGTLVSFHDSDLGRMVAGLPAGTRARTIHELGWEEISRLDVGGPGRPRRIPAAAEILGLLVGRPERRLYLDTKRLELARLAELVLGLGVAGQVILATNRDERIAEWRRLVPGAETLRWVWMDPPPQGWERAEAVIRALAAQGFPGITQLQLHILVGADGSLHPGIEAIAALAAEVQGRGVVFQAFPHCSDPAVYALLHRHGVRSFTTDHPHEFAHGLRLAGAA